MVQAEVASENAVGVLVEKVAARLSGVEGCEALPGTDNSASLLVASHKIADEL